MVKRSRTEAHGLTAPKTGNRAPKWEKWPTATKCSPQPLRDDLRDLSLPSGRENQRKPSLVRKPRQDTKEPGSPEARLAAETLKLLNEHNMQYHQALNW